MIAQKKYIITLTQVNESPIELVGSTAARLHEIEKLAVPMPQAFVVTSNAFDDFIIANDLVGYILTRINSTDYSKDKDVKRISLEIQKAIISAKFPDIIKEPILKAYAGLAGLFEAYTVLKPSPINKELDATNFDEVIQFSNVRGQDALLIKIKEIWAAMFSEAALKYRAGITYEGALSEGVLIQKMVQAEVSGKVYSVNPTDNNPELIEVQAILGLIDAMKTGEILPDSYFFKKATDEIIEKKIVGQEWMYVRKGRNAEGDPNVKVKISEIWRKKQKLEDRYILSLARIIKSLEEFYKSPVEVEYGYEAGKLFVTDVAALQGLVQPVAEAKSATPGTKPAEKSGKSIDDYVTEVHDQLQPDKQPEPTGAEEIVVTIKPVNQLERLSSGIGFGKGLEFGLVHFIASASDWEGLTSDEILILEEFDADKSELINSTRGVIIKEPISEEHLQLIKVPLVHSVSDALTIFRENEVITLDAAEGNIYEGAGKQAEPKPQIEPSETATPKSEEVSQQEESSQTPGTPEVQTENASGEGFGEVKAVTQKDHEPVKTISNAWQLLDVFNPKIDLANAAGVIVNMNDFYKLLGYTPDYLVGDPKLKLGFIEKVVDELKTLLAKLESRPMYLQLQSLSKEELLELKGAEVVNQKHIQLNGTAKLVAQPELLNMELEIFNLLRNRESMRNLWIAIPAVNNEEEQAEIKKMITAYGFRRSSTFKLASVISTPLGAVSIKPIVENDVDAVVIDLDGLLKEFTRLDKPAMNASLTSFINWVVESIYSNKSRPVLLNRNTEVTREVVIDLLAKGLSDFCLPYDDIYQFKLLLSELEVKRIEKQKKKRGRKKKKIDYGF